MLNIKIFTCMSTNFLIIVIVQFFVYLFVVKITKQKFLPLRLIMVSASAGTVIGLPFDILLGNLGLYTYLPNTIEGASNPTGLTFLELIINGIFSFGLAVATAKLLANNFTSSQSRKIEIALVFPFSLLFLTALYFCFILPKNSIALMFACGFFIVSLGELLLLLLRRRGLLAMLVNDFNIKKLVRVWLILFMIGLACEITNFFFPFWIWLPGHSHSTFLILTLMTTLGYIGVIHPMIIFWQLLGTSKKV